MIMDRNGGLCLCLKMTTKLEEDDQENYSDTYPCLPASILIVKEKCNMEIMQLLEPSPQNGRPRFPLNSNRDYTIFSFRQQAHQYLSVSDVFWLRCSSANDVPIQRPKSNVDEAASREAGPKRPPQRNLPIFQASGCYTYSYDVPESCRAVK